eukprot:CAMPEP_0168458410 /NCGR_PEP_ID=MMETSP0228-20121227/52364_1 /TAXON_ID=133427 /ORGANISM="Protoceratium reticulatum, Strain CCCM 535 (=CCMP 1889)" /LENGTH=45 /DNA_ID= /DNA_START= /DNA_END= /DNA_ORIENTATION=
MSRWRDRQAKSLRSRTVDQDEHDPQQQALGDVSGGLAGGDEQEGL